MQVKPGLWTLFCILAAACSGDRKPASVLTLEELADSVSDIAAISGMDRPSARLVSSFDRAGGNDDFNNPVGKAEDGWVVLADLKGPGYVSRFWRTGEDDGNHPIRFFFDGEKKPRVETTIGDLCGGKPPYVSPLAAREPFCWYSLAPVPYRKRLLITTRAGGLRPDGSPKLFYQVNYCQLEPGVTVESLPATLSDRQAAALDRARNRLLRIADDQPGLPEGCSGLTNSLVIAPGQAAGPEPVTGPAVIRRLKITPDFGNIKSHAARDAILRNVILRIYWNGSAQPSVEAPMGDFFGSFWEPKRFDSAYFGMRGDTLYSRFPMPFETSARLALENTGSFPVSVRVECAVEPLGQWTGKLGYFHAGWRKTGADEVGRPHPVLQAKGKGRYVGCILSVASLDPSWWILEGDETIAVDGESFPSWHGTGLEDYFNAGWYYGNVIIRPFHGLLFKAAYRTVQYRVHQTDPTAFQSSVDVRFERGSGNVTRGTMESVSFYYLAAPAQADSKPGDTVFRNAFSDPREAATLMSELNNLERLGDYAGASHHVSAFLEKAPGYPYADVLRLRLLAYEGREQGFGAVKPLVEALARTTTNQLAGKYAEDWLWYESGPSNAILGLYCNMRTIAYLDGKAVLMSTSPEQMQTCRLTLEPGRHALTLRSEHRDYPWWVQACLMTHSGNVLTSPKWRFAFSPKGSWSAADYDDSAWQEVGGLEQGKGPPEEPFIWLEPHPYVGLQSAARGIWVPIEFPDKKGSAVFRKTFDVP